MGNTFYKILAVGLLFFGTKLQAQTTTIKYLYDGAGNRINRHVLVVTQSGGRKSSSTEKSDSSNASTYQVKVYPNPTSGDLYVDVTGLEQGLSTSYQMVDLKGLPVASGIVSDQTVIGMSRSSSGVYLLKVFIGKDSHEYKVVKEN